jgi:O-antigen/teichoic acid export membrane protein
VKTEGHTLLSNGVWSLLNQVARVATLALVMIALSRHFGPTRFGSLAFGLALVRIFAVVAAFGLDRVLVRQFVETPENPAALLTAAFRLKLAIGAVTYAILIGFIFVLDPQDRRVLSIAALAGASLLLQAFDVFDYFFQANNRFRLTFLGRTLPVLLSTGIKLGAIVANASLLVFAALETLETALIGASLFLVYRWTYPAIEPSPHRLDGRRLLREGFPLVLGTLAVMIYMRSDILLLGKMAGYRAAGIYAAAAQITEACALFPLALLPALFPILLRWRKRGLEYYCERFGWLFSGAIVAGFFVALSLTISASPLVRLLYGPAFASAAPILVIHAWSALFIYLSVMQSGYDITEGLTWLAAWRTAIGAALNITLNLLLIPRQGAAGAAIATLVSQACSAFLFNLVHPRTRPVFFLQIRGFLLIPLLQLMLLGGKDRSLWASRPIATEQ